MSKRNTKPLDVLPDKDAPPGSPAWVEYVAGLANATARNAAANCKGLQHLLESLRENEAHRATGFVSFESFVSSRVGITADQMAAVMSAGPSVKVAAVLRKVGRPKAGDGNAANSRISHGTANTAYLAARLRRDHPDAVFDESVRGSVRQAAIAAGIVKVPTVLEQLRKLWKKASKKEQAAFMEGVR